LTDFYAALQVLIHWSASSNRADNSTGTLLCASYLHIDSNRSLDNQLQLLDEDSNISNEGINILQRRDTIGGTGNGFLGAAGRGPRGQKEHPGGGGGGGQWLYARPLSLSFSVVA
jgi:hypothetical protein